MNIEDNINDNDDYIKEDYEIDNEILFIKYNFVGNLKEIDILNDKKTNIKEVYFCNYVKKSCCIDNNNEYNYDDNKFRKLSIYNENINISKEGIEKIYLGQKFNGKIIKLPKSVKIINIGGCFNNSIKKLRDNLNLKILVLGINFNCSVDELPQNLECLSLGYEFNKKLNKLPSNLKHLILNNNEKIIIENLPNNLHSLVCKYYSEKPIFSVHKNSVKSYKLPTNLKKLFYISENNYKKKCYYFPNKLNFIVLSLDEKQFCYLPNSVKICSLDKKITKVKITKTKIIKFCFPNSINKIITYYDFKENFSKLCALNQFSVLNKSINPKNYIQINRCKN